MSPLNPLSLSPCVVPSAGGEGEDLRHGALPARAGNRRFRSLSALRAHTKAPYKMDFHRKTLRALNRPGRARTVSDEEERAERRADHTRLPSPVIHANCKRLRKGGPSERPHTDLHHRPRVSAPVCRGTKHYSCTVGLYGGAKVSPLAPWRQPPPRSTSRPRAPGHPPARAGPRLPHSIGRSHLIAGETTPAILGLIRWRHCHSLDKASQREGNQ